MNDKLISLPEWKLKKVENALRLTSNIYSCPKRETCFDRDVMEAWNIVVDCLNNDETDCGTSRRLTYMQTPKLIKK